MFSFKQEAPGYRVGAPPGKPDAMLGSREKEESPGGENQGPVGEWGEERSPGNGLRRWWSGHWCSVKSHFGRGLGVNRKREGKGKPADTLYIVSDTGGGSGDRDEARALVFGRTGNCL